MCKQCVRKINYIFIVYYNEMIIMQVNIYEEIFLIRFGDILDCVVIKCWVIYYLFIDYWMFMLLIYFI